MNTRTLAPVFAAIVILIAGGLGALGTMGPRVVRITAMMAAIAAVGFKAYASRDVVARLERDGQGYASAAWARSPTVRALGSRTLGAAYSNDIGALYYFAGVFADQIPLRYDPRTGLERPEYHDEFCRMRTRLRESAGTLVWFDAAAPLPEAAELHELVDGLEEFAGGPDGGIFRDRGRPIAGCEPGAAVPSPSGRSEPWSG
jgi:hypothetical protein